MNKRVTLRQATDILHEQGIEIKWDENLDLIAFFSYYDQHYAPYLENGGEKPKFFDEDFLQIFE